MMRDTLSFFAVLTLLAVYVFWVAAACGMVDL